MIDPTDEAEDFLFEEEEEQEQEEITTYQVYRKGQAPRLIEPISKEELLKQLEEEGDPLGLGGGLFDPNDPDEPSDLEDFLNGLGENGDDEGD